jgi:hypothetical protein
MNFAPEHRSHCAQHPHLPQGTLFQKSPAREINALKLNGGAAFTLVEVVISVLIMGLVFAGILTAYIEGATRVEWAGYSLAAQAQATKLIEQFRAATWDTLAAPPVDQTTNIPAVSAYVMDLPISGTNVVWVTNYTTITLLTLSTNNPPTFMKMIQVESVWPWRGGARWFTNRLVTYRAPD